MAFEILRTRSFPASADLSADQYCIVDLDSNGNIALPSAGADAIGVLQDKPKRLGEACSVCSPGDITKIVAAGTITAGQHFMSDASGHAVACTSSAHALGKALVTTATGGIYAFLFQPTGKLYGTV